MGTSSKQTHLILHSGFFRYCKELGTTTARIPGGCIYQGFQCHPPRSWLGTRHLSAGLGALQLAGHCLLPPVLQGRLGGGWCGGEIQLQPASFPGNTAICCWVAAASAKEQELASSHLPGRARVGVCRDPCCLGRIFHHRLLLGSKTLLLGPFLYPGAFR